MNQGLRVTLSCALLVGALLFLQFRSYGEAVPIRKSLDNFPAVVGDWREEEGVFFGEAVLNILKVKDYLMRRYVDPSGRSLWLYIGYWDTQRKGAQVHSPKNGRCYSYSFVLTVRRCRFENRSITSQP